MICSTGRVTRGGAAMRRPGSWPRSSGRLMGLVGWGCLTRPSDVSSGGCASAHVAPARRLVAPRRRGRRTGEMGGGRQNEVGWPALLAGAAIGVWGWRLELALAGLLVVVERLLAGVLGDVAAA